jgi:hypothetical protein
MGKGVPDRETLRKTLMRSFLAGESWDLPLPTGVWSSDGSEAGIPTGDSRPCPSGCTTDQIAIRWADGEVTWVCRKAMEPVGDGQERILP